jgi:hypothetical protein
VRELVLPAADKTGLLVNQGAGNGSVSFATHQLK